MNSIVHELTRENAAALETGVEQGAWSGLAEVAAIPYVRQKAAGAAGVPLVKRSPTANNDGADRENFPDFALTLLPSGDYTSSKPAHADHSPLRITSSLSGDRGSDFPGGSSFRPKRR
jgi:hypothetical protein